MNKILLAGFAAALVGCVSAPASNAWETVRTSSFTVSSPVYIEREVSTPVIIERQMTAPVMIDRTYTLPVILDDRDHLVHFDSPLLRFGLF